MLEAVLKRVELLASVRPTWEEKFSGGGRSGCHVVGRRKGEMTAGLIAGMDALHVGGGRNGRQWRIEGKEFSGGEPIGDQDRKKNVGGGRNSRQRRIRGEEFSCGEVACRRKGEVNVGLIADVNAFQPPVDQYPKNVGGSRQRQIRGKCSDEMECQGKENLVGSRGNDPDGELFRWKGATGLPLCITMFHLAGCRRWTECHGAGKNHGKWQNISFLRIQT
ncbi:hypothetical protein L1987_29325 [Smallanthus sonchifolius]|uniref:Uncharacterized protein n=1 Tax=Smallanthus sonchifolius TaxID=185202 RepID=A0ACB9I181_9ASTR|nr:hypothetical protein L1987_29325 [Smallanthus sonchifolius]